MKNTLQDMLEFNEQFVDNKEYEPFQADKYPKKKLVIVSCMDTRLVELLPRALNLSNGDVKIIKVAGAIVAHPFGSTMRSILVAVYALQADEVCVIGHHDCGMTGLKTENIIQQMKERGISEQTLDGVKYFGIDLDKWLHGFSNVEDSVRESVNIIKNHPLLPRDVPVHGLVMDPHTGKVDCVEEGY